MHRHPTRPTATGRLLPACEPGLTVLDTPHHRSGALHHVALQFIRACDGPAYWLDARNTASTYALRECTDRERLLRRIRIARAFTAYQHYTLVERVLNRVRPGRGCVVVPNVASLYRDDDVPDYEGTALLEAVASALAELGRACDLPVLATVGGPDDAFADEVRTHASATYTCERTAQGYRFEGETFETDVYWTDDYWQTTIPYWVDLLGAVGDSPERSLTGPALTVTLEG